MGLISTTTDFKIACTIFGENGMVLDIKNIDNHVIESMFKRYIDNA